MSWRPRGTRRCRLKRRSFPSSRYDGYLYAPLLIPILMIILSLSMLILKTFSDLLLLFLYIVWSIFYTFCCWLGAKNVLHADPKER